MPDQTTTQPATITREDAFLAAKVLFHLNDTFDYGSTECWSPNELQDLIAQTPEERGRAQIEATIRVLQAMNAVFGEPGNSTRHAPAVVARWAVELEGASS